MQRCGDDWKKAPRWMKELHAWQSGRHAVTLTLPTCVSREFSLLHKPQPLGFEGLLSFYTPRTTCDKECAGA